MSLRETLERIWNDGSVRCPKHLVWWNDREAECTEGGRVLDFTPAGEGLFWRKGKLAGPVKPDAGVKREAK